MIYYFSIFLLQILIFIFPSLIFLFFYHEKFNISLDILLTHVQLIFFVASGWIIIITLTIITSKKDYLKLPKILTYIWFFVNISVYIFMAGGLVSWGKIPTIEILIVYIKQIDATLQAINASIWSTIFLLITFFAFVIFFSLLSLKIFKILGNSKQFKNQCQSLLFLLLTLSLTLTGIYKTWLYEIIYDNNHKDPLELMIFKSSSDMSPNALLAILGQHKNRELIAHEDELRKTYQTSITNRPKSIILIIVDALRPDRMGIYGAQRQTTPYLQKMFEQGDAHLIQEARSSCSETTCGILSLLSGKEPQQLLVRNFNLTDILGQIGYKRYFYLSGDHTNFYGARYHYGSYDHYQDGTSNPEFYINDDRWLQKAITKLPEAQKDEQYFFTILLMSAHGLGTKHPEFMQWQPAKSIYNLSFSLERNLNEYHNHYDNGILQADFMINDIYNNLIKKGYIDDSSIVLLTSDHGESLGEHGIRAHAASLHEVGIRIPWIWLGKNPLGNLNDPVIQADFAPTVLHEIGAEIPDHWRGIPLQKGTSERQYTFHAQIPYAGIIHYAPNKREKLMFNYRDRSRYFFDLLRDPKELEEHHTGDSTLEKLLDDSGLSYLGNF